MDCKQALGILKTIPLTYEGYRNLIRTLIKKVREKNGQPRSKADRSPDELDERELRQKILESRTYSIPHNHPTLSSSKRAPFLIRAWAKTWLLFYYDLCSDLEKANALDESELKEVFAKSKGNVLENLEAVLYKKEIEEMLEGLANWDSLWRALSLYLKGDRPGPETSRELTLGFPLVVGSRILMGYVHLKEGSQPIHPKVKLLPDPLVLAYFPMAPKSLDTFKNLLDRFEKAFPHRIGTVWVSLRTREAEWLLLEGGSFGLSLHVALEFFPELGLNYLPHKLLVHEEIAMSGSVDQQGERLEPIGDIGQKLHLVDEYQNLGKIFIVDDEGDRELKENYKSKVILLNPAQHSAADVKELFSQDIKRPIERLLKKQKESFRKYPQMHLLKREEGSLDEVFEEPEVEALPGVWEGVQEAEGNVEGASKVFLPEGQARLREPRRILLWGEQGSGKSTLAKWLALKLQEKGTPAVYVNLAWLKDVALELEGQGELTAKRLLVKFITKRWMEKNGNVSEAILNGFIETHFASGYGRAHESGDRAWLILDSLEQIESDTKTEELFARVFIRDIKSWPCNLLFCARSSSKLQGKLVELEKEIKLEKKRLVPLKTEKVKSLLEKLLDKEQGGRLYGLIRKDALLLERLRWPINVVLFAAGFGGEDETPSFRKTLEHLIKWALKDKLTGSRGGEKELIWRVIRGLARSVWDSAARGSDLTYSIQRADARKKITEELLNVQAVLSDFTPSKRREDLKGFADEIAEEVLKKLEDEQTGPFFNVFDEGPPSLEFHSRQFFNYLLSLHLAEKLKAGEKRLWQNFKKLLDYPLIGEIAWLYANEQDPERGQHISELLKALNQRDRDDVFHHKLFLACQVLAARPEAPGGRGVLESTANYLLQQKEEVLHFLCPWNQFPFKNTPLLKPGSRLRKVLESELEKAKGDGEAREEEYLRALNAAHLLLPVVEEKRKEILRVLRKGIQSQFARVAEVSARIVGEFADQLLDGTEEELLALVEGLRRLAGEEGRDLWVRVATIWSLGRLSEVVDPKRVEKRILEELKKANEQMYGIVRNENSDEWLEFTALWALLRSRIYLESSLQNKVGELLDVVLKRWDEGSRRDRSWPSQAFLMLAVRIGRELFWVRGDFYGMSFAKNESYRLLLKKAIEEKRPLLFEAAVQAYLKLHRYVKELEEWDQIRELIGNPDSLREELRRKDRVFQLINLLNESEDRRVSFSAAELLGRPLILTAGLGQELKDEYENYPQKTRGPIRIHQMGEAGKIAEEVVLAIATKLQTEERNSLLRPLARSMCAWHEIGVRVYQNKRTGEKEVFYLGRPPLKKVFGEADR